MTFHAKRNPPKSAVWWGDAVFTGEGPIAKLCVQGRPGWLSAKKTGKFLPDRLLQQPGGFEGFLEIGGTGEEKRPRQGPEPARGGSGHLQLDLLTTLAAAEPGRSPWLRQPRPPLGRRYR